jgi:glycosyltransferase involved in cell wall biosynthesis
MAEVLDHGFSIVLCTHNGESKLEPTLTHLAALKIPVNVPVELVLVNNASTDNTEAFSKSLWLQLGDVFSLRFINEPRPGKGYATETGYDVAQYAYIITVDDDNWLREDYLINALPIIQQYPDVGIFQAGNEPVFEVTPPAWVQQVKGHVAIGSPIKETGYFPKNNYGVWGAGMIVFKKDWMYLRNLGFAVLTSKVPGKAAGEDVELAFALLLLGRKIYYSDCLHYKHYMPAARLNWKSIEKAFETFGYTAYYIFLYAMVFDAFEKKYILTPFKLRAAFYKQVLRQLKSRGVKNNINYILKQEASLNRLMLKQYYNTLHWFNKLSGKAMKDIHFIQSWMLSLLEHNPNGFRM